MRNLEPLKTLATALALAAAIAQLALLRPAGAEAPGTLGKSVALEASGNLPGALRVAQEVADRDPKHYFARLRVAYLEALLKNHAAAARDYTRAAELAPRSVEPLLGKQQALMALGRYADSLPVAKDIQSRDEHNYLANSRLAWALYNLKRYTEAEKAYTSVLSLYPGDIEMMIGLGYSQLRGGRKLDAAETFRTVLGITPNNPRAREGLLACR